jgi:uncharacterized protein
VLLNYGDYIAYDDDISSGIKDLLAQAKTGAPTTTTNTGTGTGGGTTVPSGGSPAITSAINQINKALADLSSAQKSGDFQKYGDALSELKKATAAYQAALKAAGATPTPTPTPSGTPSAPPSVPPSSPPSTPPS